MQVPIACNLTDQAARSQLEEWRNLLPKAAVAAERTSPTDLVFLLKDGLPHLPALVGLAQREKACCGFFDFAIVIAADHAALRVSVPPDAAALLDDFGRLSFSA